MSAALVVAALAASSAVSVVLLTGSGPASAQAPDTSAPTQPGTITASGVTATSVALAWGRSTDDVGVEGYRVYRSEGAGVTPSRLIATTDAVASYPAVKLYSGRTYTFGVTAIDSANNQSPMRTVTVTTAPNTDTTAPAAPSSSSLSARIFSSSRIDLVWGTSSSDDVAGYQLSRDGVVIATVDLPGTPRFSDNGLTASTSYSYTVKAIDSAGNLSAPTTARKGKTLAAGTVIIARGPMVSNATATSAVVSWWTNLPTPGSITINGATVVDPAGVVQQHVVTVTGLSGGTGYPYTVTSNGVTATGTVRTAATPGSTFTFAAIGDFGGGSSAETQNAANIAAGGTQFVQTLGDDIYPSSGLPDPDFNTTYSDFDQRFFKPFAGVVNSQAFFPANGNKEYYDDGEFWAAFPMPGTNHSWYSYDWGDAHILVLDSEQPFEPGTDQHAFAQSDLAAHQSAKWRIVAIQRPAYSSSSANSSSKPVQTYLVPLFQTQKVNLVLSGNSHNYERNLPMLNGAADPSGITYIVSGGGGNGFNQFTVAPPSYSAYREASWYEHLNITVSPTALTVKAIRADGGAVIDSTTITAAAQQSPPTVPANVTATAASSSEIDLAWTASTSNVGVDGYRIYRSDKGTTPYRTVTGTTFQDTGLAAGTTYSYTVSAVDAAGNESAQSTPVATAKTAPASNTPTLRLTASGTTASNLTATFAGSGTTSGNLLVLTAALYTGATRNITSVTDSAGNVWSRVGTYYNAGHNSEGEMWYVANAKPVTTVTIATTASSAAFQVQEFSGIAGASPLHLSAGASITSTTASSGAVTAAAGELVVGFAAGHGNGQAMTLTSPNLASQPQTTVAGTSGASVVTGYQVASAPASSSVGASFGTAMYWAAAVATFRPAA